MFMNFLIAEGNGGGQSCARLELNFASHTWSVKSGHSAWLSVGSRLDGIFETKSWGVMWLWEKVPRPVHRIIVHDAPTGEDDFTHLNGRARLFKPAKPSFQDAIVPWKAEKPAGGSLTPIRRRILNIIASAGFGMFPAVRKNFPYGPLTPAKVMALEAALNKNRDPALPRKTVKTTGVTNCGSFPGWVVSRIGGSGIDKALNFKFSRGGQNYGTSESGSMTQWDVWAQEFDKQPDQIGKDPVWISAGGGKRPKPGDIYVLDKVANADRIPTTDGIPDTGGKPLSSSGFGHVGFIISAEGSVWKTADTGQGGGYDGAYQNRAYSDAAGTLYLNPSMGTNRLPPDLGLRLLKGWVDVDRLFANWRG